MKHFELSRIRDFGEVISDSFEFLKDHFKELFKSLLYICGILILTSSIAYFYMQKGMMELTDRAGQNYVNESIAMRMFTGMGFYYFSLMLFIFGVYVITFCYISVYREKQEEAKPTVEEVWAYFKYYFFRSLGSCFLMLIMILVGTVLCILPGIYLSTVFYLILPIMIIENSSFSYAFSKSFKLISGNWWLTFGVVFVMSLIVGFGSSIAGLPIMVITSLKKFISFGVLATPLLLFFSILAHVLMLGYALIAIAVTLCYFSYTEQKEGTGLMGRINQLGNNDNDNTHLPTEQY